MSEAFLSLAAWRGEAAKARGAFRARMRAQIAGRVEKQTKGGKPYFELEFADATGKETFRIWSDAPFFTACATLNAGDWVEFEGDFEKTNFGIEPRRLAVRALTAPEVESLLTGSPERQARLASDAADLQRLIEGMREPRLRALCLLLLARHGVRFRRAAAARTFHHARRGGLLEHTSQMMRAAEAVCIVYPHLHRDLLLAGVLFHDCGKMWECTPAEDGFGIVPNETGELLGHITIGFELANKLWTELRETPEFRTWETLEPRSEMVRQHLLHLIASHHGEYAFGSPVLPKTPEAMTLHYLDNLDAKLEMFAGAYANAKQLAPGIFERVPPLPTSPILPLPLLRESNAVPGARSSSEA